jgi:putative hemolysin
MITLLVGVLVSLVMSAFFSGTESGFYFIKNERLKFLEAGGSKAANVILGYLKHPGVMLSTLLVGNNLALQLGTDSMMRYVSDQDWHHPILTAEILTTLILFLPFFIFGEVLPKATYRLYCEELLLKTVPIIAFFRVIFFPISFVVGGIAHLLRKKFKVTSEDDFSFDRNSLSTSLGHAYAGGVFSPEQMESIGQVMNSGDQPVERMMTSLTQCPMFSLDISRQAVSDIYDAAPYTAYPVYAQKKTDIVGWVDMRRLAKVGFSDAHLLDCLQKPVTVPMGTPFHDAISLFFEKEVPIIFVLSRDDKIVGSIFWVDALLKLLR